MDESDKKRAFWNARTGADHPGSNDFILKRLELELVESKVTPGSHVLDVGCGDGETLVYLAERRSCSGVGVDFAERMLEAARARAAASAAGYKLSFVSGELPDLPSDLGVFDYIVTERCLINLGTLEAQRAAFYELMQHLKPGGTYLMIESFVQGLARSNALRASLALSPITAPWHNTFLDEDVVASWETPSFRLVERYPFTSTYHFLSRVVYAKVAAQRGEELCYDSDINLLALDLPPIGDLGPVRLFSWKREPSGTGQDLK